MQRSALLAGAVGVVLSGLLMAGCAGSAARTGAPGGDTASSETSTPVAAVRTVPDGVYLADLVTGHEVVPGSSITLTFAGSDIGVAAGCNSGGGSYSIAGGQLTVTSLARTEMACEQTELMDQDDWVAAFLTAAPAIDVQGDTVTLTGRGATVESITLRKSNGNGEVPLDGTRWLLESIQRGGTVSSVPAGVEPVIVIAGGRISFDAQCNSVGGNVAVEFDSLTVTEVISTMMACDGSRGEMEELLTGTIKDTVGYTLADGRLTITGKQTTLVFTATPAPPADPDAPKSAPAVTTTSATPAPDLGTDLLTPSTRFATTPEVVVPSVP